jgi:hypothetical protein
MSILANPDLWIAVLSGGVIVKLIDQVVPVLLNGRSRRVQIGVEEREALRRDIEYLRGEIGQLRNEVAELRVRIREREEEVTSWRLRFWRAKSSLDRVMIFVHDHVSPDVHSKLIEIVDLEDDNDG